jgi:hypothetical protein
MKTVYFVHDLNDPAVLRRVDMLTRGGAEITLIGFRRGPRGAPIPGVGVVDLGTTQNGRMVSRAAAVLSAWRRRRRWQRILDGAELVLARNLECLALAAPARRRRCPKAKLVFECLDIHRLMLGSGAVGRAMRGLEARLLARSDALIVSSPAFVDAYFSRVHRRLPPQLLVENRVLEWEMARVPPATQPPTLPAGPLPGPPWRIGWYGVIRCARSLALLAALARALPGRVEVEIRGRPARDALPDFDAVVAATPGFSFLGAYDRRRDLGVMYGGVHFAWTMDFYEPGANSDWLLPNRLYEGSLHGPVALAFAGSETGRWFARHGAGIVLPEPLDRQLEATFRAMDVAAYAAARAGMGRIPRKDLIYTEADCRALLPALAAPASEPARGWRLPTAPHPPAVGVLAAHPA